MKILLTGILAFVFCATHAFTQTDGTGQQAPQPVPPSQSQTEQPSDYPEYIVRPKEDLNPFGKSSIGESTTGSEYREGAGTLGTTQQRPSNLDINKQLKEKGKKKAGESVESAEPSETEVEIDYDTAYPTGRTTDVKKQPSKTGIYRWTDDEGVIHVTNDLGSIPPKYMNQIKDQLKEN